MCHLCHKISRCCGIVNAYSIFNNIGTLMNARGATTASHNQNELVSTVISSVMNEWSQLPLERAPFSEHQARGKKKIDFPAALSPVAMVTLQTPLSPFRKGQTLPVYEPVCSDHTLALALFQSNLPFMSPVSIFPFNFVHVEANQSIITTLFCIETSSPLAIS